MQNRSPNKFKARDGGPSGPGGAARTPAREVKCANCQGERGANECRKPRIDLGKRA